MRHGHDQQHAERLGDPREHLHRLYVRSPAGVDDARRLGPAVRRWLLVAWRDDHPRDHDRRRRHGHLLDALQQLLTPWLHRVRQLDLDRVTGGDRLGVPPHLLIVERDRQVSTVEVAS